MVDRSLDATGDGETAVPPAGPESTEVEQLRAKLDEVLRAYSRAQQDKEEFRKRAEREKERVLEVERGKVALELVEIADQLELSLAAAGGDSQSQGLASGVRLIHEGLLQRLARSGLVRQSTEGAKFDPSRHEAVETVPVADPELDGRVLSERRAGYVKGDRVVRPARVSVGKLAPGGNN